MLQSKKVLYIRAAHLFTHLLLQVLHWWRLSALWSIRLLIRWSLQLHILWSIWPVLLKLCNWMSDSGKFSLRASFPVARSRSFLSAKYCAPSWKMKNLRAFSPRSAKASARPSEIVVWPLVASSLSWCRHGDRYAVRMLHESGFL
jgi:hypothetical protein